MMAAALAMAGLGPRWAKLLASPAFWGGLLLVVWSLWLVHWAGDRRERQVRAEYARALEAKNNEIEQLNADWRQLMDDRRLSREGILAQVFEGPAGTGTGCDLDPQVIRNLNRIK